MDIGLQHRSLALNILEPAILSLMTILCLVGNILICLAVYRNPSLRTSTNLFVVALAVSDFLNAFIVMSLAVGVLITGRWPYGDTICNFHAFFTLFSVYVSPSTMGLAAFNRYIRIVKSNLYPRVFSLVRSRVLVGLTWLFVACYVLIPRLIGWYKYKFSAGYAVCTISHPTSAAKVAHYAVVVPLFLFLPFGVSAFSYYNVFKTINQHNINIAATVRTSQPESQISNRIKEIRITKSLAIVVLAFGLCWIPFWIIAILQRFSSGSFVPRNVQLSCTFLFFFSSTINPFIYARNVRSFKAEFRNILLCWRKRRVSDRNLDLQLQCTQREWGTLRRSRKSTEECSSMQ